MTSSTTYELAKQLKDAGFPLKKWTGSEGSGPDFEIDGVAYHEPSLSELVEACGNISFRLERFIREDGEERGSWLVECREIDWFAYFSTPEEAVAKLWLELNKK